MLPDVSKGKKALILLLPLLLAATLVGYWTLHPAEPTYQGRPVGAWLDQLAAPKIPSDADAALKVIGSNAIPFIIRRLNDSDSALTIKYRSLYPGLPARLAKLLPKPMPEFRVSDAASALHSIGPPIEPTLVKLLKDRRESVRAAAALALSFLRFYDRADIKIAVPSLIEALHDPSKQVRLFATLTLGWIGPDAVLAVPDLIPLLNESKPGPVPGSRIFAGSAVARTLGKIGPGAKSALPALRILLTNQDAYLKAVTAVAIWRIDGDVTNTLPILIQELPQVLENSKWEPIECMAEMGPLARSAIPALVKESHLPPESAWNRKLARSYTGQKIADALNQIDPAGGTNAVVK